MDRFVSLPAPQRKSLKQQEVFMEQAGDIRYPFVIRNVIHQLIVYLREAFIGIHRKLLQKKRLFFLSEMYIMMALRLNMVGFCVNINSVRNPHMEETIYESG